MENKKYKAVHEYSDKCIEHHRYYLSDISEKEYFCTTIRQMLSVWRYYCKKYDLVTLARQFSYKWDQDMKCYLMQIEFDYYNKENKYPENMGFHYGKFERKEWYIKMRE